MREKSIGGSLHSRYRRFFMGKHTALVAAFVSILLFPMIVVWGRSSGGLDVAGIYDLLIRIVLIGTLFYSLKTHKLFLMQAALVGLMFCMLCVQSQLALGLMENQDSEIYITMGLQGFVFLSCERMLLFIQSFICVSHFIIHSSQKQKAVRVSLNQVALLFLLGLLIVQLCIAHTLSFEWSYILYLWTLHLDELFIFILIACAELVLMIDQDEYIGGKSND